MANLILDSRQKRRIENEAEREGLLCQVCESPLRSRGTAIGFGDGSIRVYLDCYKNRAHRNRASLFFNAQEARSLLNISASTRPRRRNPGETTPRA
jgi:hypothetical protein